MRSAGAVLWRPAPGADPDDPAVHHREIAVIHRPIGDDWSLPKGKLKNGEHLLSAAVREVGEETGTAPVLGRRLPPQHYLKNGWPKRVDWWVGTPAASTPFVAGHEVDRMAWLPLPQARARLTYAHDVRVLDDFARGPARTTPLIVLRHASAGDKRTWDGDDLLRPLDAAGRADAAELARVLAAYGTPRLVSSAAARCVDTLLPFSTACGAEVRTRPALTAGNGGAGGIDRAAARAAFADLLGGVLAGRPTLVCTHGELVGDLVRDALDRLGAPAPQQLALRKGGFWVLHVGPDGTLAAAERHTPRG
nr:NUDIX domain-containing protein [Nocardiopsis trehalosi]